MKAIVAVDQNWGIGYQGKLVISLPEDMEYFRNTTSGKMVVLGSATLRTLPNAQPLRNRTNIILTRDTALNIPNAIICRSITQLADILSGYPTEDIFIIGGQSVYAQLLDCCSHALITKYQTAFKADRFFPNVDQMHNWLLVRQSERKEQKGIAYTLNEYINRAVKPLESAAGGDDPRNFKHATSAHP